MVEVTGEKLGQLKKENKKILLDLHGVWCGPCKQLMPKLESIEKEFPNVEFVKMDVDKNRNYVMELGITSIPTVIFYDGDKTVNRTQGAQPESVYKNILNTL
jgi:thioredoxin 1